MRPALTAHSPTRSSQVVKIAQPFPGQAVDHDNTAELEETYLLANKREIITRQEIATGVDNDSQVESPMKLLGAGKYQTIGD